MLKLQYFGHLIRRTDPLEKTLMLGKIEGRRRRGQQRMRWLDKSPTQWTSVSANSGRWWRTGKPGVLQSMGSLRVGHGWTTELNWYMCYSLKLCFMLYTSGSVLCYRGKIVGYYNERTVFDTHLNLKILSNTYLNMLFKKHDSILMIFLGILSL